MKSWAAVLTALFTTFAPLAAYAQATAPPGYHYESEGTPVPNDPCWLPPMASAGAVAHLNRTLSKPQGVPRRVLSINDLASVSPNSLPSIGLGLVGWDTEQGGIACHVTLRFQNNSTQSGVLSMYNPGEYATLRVQWIPDTTIARRLADYDRLRNRKALAVVPNLKNAGIQTCVGRAFALGAQEQFPGQLWAACAQRNGSDLIPPASLEKHW
jgi:hypothetical protein